MNNSNIPDIPEKNPEIHMALDHLDKNIEVLSARLTRLFEKLEFVSGGDNKITENHCDVTSKYASVLGRNLESKNDKIENLIERVDYQINKLEI